jgi:hypothetical protein
LGMRTKVAALSPSFFVGTSPASLLPLLLPPPPPPPPLLLLLLLLLSHDGIDSTAAKRQLPPSQM